MMFHDSTLPYSPDSLPHNQDAPEGAEDVMWQGGNRCQALSNMHFDLGVVLHQQGQLEAASTCYLDALRLRSDHVEAHYNL